MISRVSIIERVTAAVSEPWVVMWLIGVIVYFAIKAALANSVSGWTLRSLVTYLLVSPTLDPVPFLHGRRQRGKVVAADDQWWTGLVGLLAGGVIWAVAVPALRLVSDWLAGWAVMAGVICLLHFGIFRLMTARLRTRGWAVEPIMNAPWKSESVAEFWGSRWNVAFRDAAQRLVVSPLRRKMSAPQLLFVVFLVSGLIHDIVMSTPSGGWGLATMYFLLQAGGQAVSKTPLGTKLRLNHGRTGFAFTAALVLLPLPLLFHRPFSEQIMVPFYEAVTTPVLDFFSLNLSPAGIAVIGGLMQLSVLAASFATPFLLDWKPMFEPLPKLLRQMFWVYGAYIVLAIIALAAASIAWPEEVAGKSSLGRAVACCTALFWGIRLLIGLFYFDARPYLTSRMRQFGYAVLNTVFALLTVIYCALALAGAA